MANQITYGDASRQAILRGVNSLANAVKVTLGPRGRNVILDRKYRLAHDHQGRRHGREGNRAEGRAREHGRPDGQGSREQDVRCRGRRHHDGDRAGAGDLSRRREERHRRRQPDGRQARNREGGRGDHGGADADVEAGDRRHDRAGRHHLGEPRRDHRRHHRGRDGRRWARTASSPSKRRRRSRRHSRSSKACSSIAATSRRTSSPMPSAWKSCSRIRSS